MISASRRPEPAVHQATHALLIGYEPVQAFALSSLGYRLRQPTAASFESAPESGCARQLAPRLRGVAAVLVGQRASKECANAALRLAAGYQVPIVLDGGDSDAFDNAREPASWARALTREQLELADLVCVPMAPGGRDSMRLRGEQWRWRGAPAVRVEGRRAEQPGTLLLWDADGEDREQWLPALAGSASGASARIERLAWLIAVGQALQRGEAFELALHAGEAAVALLRARAPAAWLRPST